MKRVNKDTSVNGKCRLTLMVLMGAFLVLVMMGLSVLFSVSTVLLSDPRPVVEAQNLDSNLQEAIVDENEVGPPPADDDLLPAGFDEKSCLSRHQSVLYRRGGALRKASPRLISKLRSYEARHKQCGPYTDSYNKTVQRLKSGQYLSSDCNYVVWIPIRGLGNKILTLASAFLYALLTHRVLLVDRGIDIHALFCEPFPEASWLLPLDFPLTHEFRSFHRKSNQSYGNVLRRSGGSTAVASLLPQPYIYLHLLHDFDNRDKQFFCDQDQAYLHKVPWLVIRSNNYFIPTLFLMPSFEQELHGLFPDKEALFHLLGRYLFHPTNSVWGLVTRYYEAYLSKADVIVGIQIRVFDSSPAPLLDQILSCTTREKILPGISRQKRGKKKQKQKKKTTVAVLMTSLTSNYSEQLRDLYWENPTATGEEVVAVFQPSKEGRQQSGKQDHNQKAWAEIYLLSLTNKLVTSSWSTFGYVAQGLGGLKPWILRKPGNQTAPDPPCRRAMSMEPCCHATPFYDCKARKGIDSGALVPHVRHCEDMSWGIKLIQPQIN